MSDHNERACTKCGSLLHHEDKCSKNMSTTPRTDAVLNYLPQGYSPREFVFADFARQLETELIALQENYEATGRVVLARDSTIASLQEERDQLLAAVDGLRDGIITCLKYPRGSEAQVRCLEELWQDVLQSSVPPTNLVKPLSNHTGDCTIYRSVINGRPYDGICTCGYGWQESTKSPVMDRDETYLVSSERVEYNMSLVKRSVLEKLVNSVMECGAANDHFKLDQAMEEAHEELERTK